MSGDPTKAAIWTDADVYVAPLGSSVPINASVAWDAAWDLIGLLDGEDGIEQHRDEDVTDHFAWGGILVRTTRKNFKLTYKFTALEDNETTRELFWPGSTPGAVLVRPLPARMLFGFELTEGSTIHRYISAYQAEIALVGDIKDNETDLTKYMFEATIFPNDDSEYMIERSNDLPTS